MSNIWPPYWCETHSIPAIKITKTDGSFIYSDENTKIFDGISSWWSMCHGYKHPHIIAKMQECLQKMPHVMFAGITHSYAETLAKCIYEFTYNRLQKTFFCDSGSVAVEVSIKMALQYWIARQNYDKKYILTFSGCYHGETFMSSALSSDEKSHTGTYVANVLNVVLPKTKEEMNNFCKFLEQNHKNIACAIIEPLVQGAAGIKMYSAEILRDIFIAIKRYDILFISDECAMGFYRTGRRFAFDHAEILPDIITLGKALSGGHISLAAVTTNEHIFKTICSDGYFRHGPTFMANPLACSAGIASYEVFNSFNYSAHVKKISTIFKDFAKNLQVEGVSSRVFGAILAVDINANSYGIKSFIYENISKLKLWVRPINNTLYMMPPLNVAIEDLLIALHSFGVIIKNTHRVI